MQRPADGAWIKDYYFYVYKKNECLGSQGSGCGTSDQYTISSQNPVNVIFIKGYNAGHYSIASLFTAISWGYTDSGGWVTGIADAHTSSQNREMHSDLLAIEWCDGGTC